ncbi:hypothetical protein A7A09_019560 [Paracoccus methylarcula]|uniref:Transposase n=1 Tax=Paracoccus methylarcula TaxID=72022 RepID=A0A3R7SBQ5_9RHOB|nr:hypothetical protein A7A09_019560 [Paracoccus methylarcula]
MPDRRSRAIQVRYGRRRYRWSGRIGVISGWLKDYRRIATGDDHGPRAFLSAITLAAITIYWLWSEIG